MLKFVLIILFILLGVINFVIYPYKKKLITTLHEYVNKNNIVDKDSTNKKVNDLDKIITQKLDNFQKLIANIVGIMVSYMILSNSLTSIKSMFLTIVLYTLGLSIILSVFANVALRKQIDVFVEWIKSGASSVSDLFKKLFRRENFQIFDMSYYEKSKVTIDDGEKTETFIKEVVSLQGEEPEIIYSHNIKDNDDITTPKLIQTPNFTIPSVTQTPGSITVTQPSVTQTPGSITVTQPSVTQTPGQTRSPITIFGEPEFAYPINSAIKRFI